jgi:tRNA pseudouridine38-40 synthase
MNNIKMVIAYVGTNYLGWQKTPFGTTIEAEIEKVLQTLLQHEIHLQACSRTDAGVHAKEQVVNFFTNSGISLDLLEKKINSMLPKDIAVLKIEKVPPTFHPTLWCKKKEYEYSICRSPIQLPFHQKLSWHYPHPLEIHLMVKGAFHLIGTHDFTAFANKSKNNPLKHNIRTVIDICIKQNDDMLKISIIGDKFLYKMARNIVGTLIYVGKRKIVVEQIPEILENRDRRYGGITAPAHGLTLKKLYYD